MAVSLTATRATFLGGGTTTHTFPWGSTGVTVGNLLVLHGVSTEASTSLVSASTNGQPFAIDHQEVPGGAGWFSQFCCSRIVAAVTEDDGDFSLTFSGLPPLSAVRVVELAGSGGFDGSRLVGGDDSYTAAAGSSYPCGSVVAAAGDFAVAHIIADGGAAISSWSDSYTPAGNISDALFLAHKALSAAGATAPVGTGGSAVHRTGLVAVYQEAGAAPAERFRFGTFRP
jgi:hypothetical protein